MRIASTTSRTCKSCGSLYLVVEYRVETENTGTITCQVCGATLLRWNGAHTFEARLIAGGGDHAGAA